MDSKKTSPGTHAVYFGFSIEYVSFKNLIIPFLYKGQAT